MNLKKIDHLFLFALMSVYLAGIVFTAISGIETWQLGATGLLVLIAIIVQIEIFRRVYPHVSAQTENYRQLECLFSLFGVMKLNAPLPPMRGWAVSPDFANILVSLVREIRPKCIVEAGSGVSTILSAYCLKEIGSGKVFSLDQDVEFGRKTTESLKRHGLGDVAQVVQAPLKNLIFEGQTYIWYDTACIGVLPTIDLLVIDGPPEFLHDLARYPALPVLFEKLAPSAVVLIDDAVDACNRRIVDLWMKEFPVFEKEWIDTEKGTVILRRK